MILSSKPLTWEDVFNETKWESVKRLKVKDDVIKLEADVRSKYQSNPILNHLQKIISYEMNIKECMAKWVINKFGYPNDVFFYEQEVSLRVQEWGFMSVTTDEVFCKCVETQDGLNRNYEYFAPKELLAQLELIRH